MADRTKFQVLSKLAWTHPPSQTPGDAPIPERPDWMGTRKALQVRGRQQGPGISTSKPPRVAGDADRPMQKEPTFKHRAVAWLSSAAATGYGLSLLFHALVLVGMGFWFFPQIVESTSIITVVDSDVDEPSPFDAMDDVHLESPAGSEEIVVPQLTEVVQRDAELNVLEQKFLQDVTAAHTEGEGGSSDVGSGGFRLLEPKNAVKAGSFTAWTIPIARTPGEQPKAGDSPRPGQDYHIVIQVKIPATRTTYNISDLSGKVIGTDGYIQPIPAMAFTQDEEGRLIRANLGRRLPIVDGVVQILIRVPGAEALVKDTIRIKSKLLHEDQTLVLIFGKHNRQELKTSPE